MRIALIQLSSARDIDKNLATCRRLAEGALEAGARWLLFPENAPFMGHDAEKLTIAEDLDGSIVAAFREIARQGGCWVSLGSFPEASTTPGHTSNTQLLIDPAGNTAALYRKIHLFDVEVEGKQIFRESDSVLPGSELTVAPIELDAQPSRNVGLSVCYDLRFPELYRALVKKGAHMLTVPSAFTLSTGRDHWHALLQARAIENQCFVLAPNQWGHHFDNRHSYGHSAVYDPWGRMIACASDRESFVLAELDFDYLDEVRAKMPCLGHRRL